MNNKSFGKLKFIITVSVVCLFIWFLVIYPMIDFHKSETTFSDAAKRYFDLNSDKLPTGERVKTLSLSVLYDEAYLKEDLKVPYSRKVCSLEKSWVKVRRVNGEYVYYVYLDCGVLKSTVDHTGPKIKLNGDEDIVINVGEKYKDLGVKSITDNRDGKIKIDSATIKSDVDTSKVGNYEVKYTVFDNLGNKGETIRKVTVVKKLINTVKKSLGKSNYYKGDDPNNYIYFSNNLYRILSIDGKNIKIVSDSDISNVNYDSIDDWFKYYEENLTDSAKKIIVKNKYCNMRLSDNKLGTTKCSSYSRNKYYGLLSINDINNVTNDDGNYLIGKTISWTANEGEGSKVYAFRDVFSGTEANYYGFDKEHNLGVRPVVTIKGDNLITKGNGTISSPYVLNDYIKAKKNDKINSRYVGEYISYGGVVWRIQSIEKDNTTKVIANQTLSNEEGYIKIYYDNNIKETQYNPLKKGNVGYKINNETSKYIDTGYFVKHNIIVPIYKGEPKYNKENKNNKYSVKISSPNMYDMYSATSNDYDVGSYWLLNSSSSSKEIPGVSDTGSVMYGVGSVDYMYGIRPVGYLNKNVVIVDGNGTLNYPFVIKK